MNSQWTEPKDFSTTQLLNLGLKNYFCLVGIMGQTDLMGDMGENRRNKTLWVTHIWVWAHMGLEKEKKYFYSLKALN